MMRAVRWLRWLAASVIAAALVGILGKPMVQRIVISKSSRTLTAYGSSGEVVHRVPIALGRNPEGPKELEGDERTPEGEYYVCFKNPKSRFFLSLGLSYPNLDDARRGLDAGRIGADEFAAIADAQRGKRMPPWKTPLGGEIFIHGEKGERDGTAGCVAVENRVMAALFPIVDVGTPVVIEP
jgi:murein L,D-transpeptidase YafK